MIREAEVKQDSAFIVLPYQPDHLRALVLQDAQSYLRPLINGPEYAEGLMRGPAYTAFAGGRPLVCAGVLEQWTGRANAWAVVGSFARDHMLPITRAVRDFLDSQDYARIDTCVRAGFHPGLRWARLLGFADEGVMRRWMYGDDFHMFARVR